MEVIRIAIGSEPMQHLPAQVLKSSIMRRTRSLVEFTESWTVQAGWHPIMRHLPKLKGGTAFNTFRFCVPGLYLFGGRSIYLDADQIVLADVAELWGSLPSGKTIACVRNAVGFFGKKVPEPEKNQTSVMVIDNARAQWDVAGMARDVAEGRLVYADFMQAAWLPRDDVQELPPAWNHFGACTPETKLLHYSHVGSQPWRNPEHPTAHVWWHELRETLNAGHLQMSDVEHAVAQGHLHAKFLKRLEKTSV